MKFTMLRHELIISGGEHGIYEAKHVRIYECEHCPSREIKESDVSSHFHEHEKRWSLDVGPQNLRR